MKKGMTSKLMLIGLAVVTVGLLSPTPAHAYWGRGPHVGVSLGFGYNPYYGGYYGPGYYGYPAYYAPPPTVVYAEQPPQVVYTPAPAPTYYAPAPAGYAQPAQAAPSAGTSAYPGYMGQ